jgi:hypothetical protein
MVGSSCTQGESRGTPPRCGPGKYKFDAAVCLFVGTGKRRES